MWQISENYLPLMGSKEFSCNLRMIPEGNIELKQVEIEGNATLKGIQNYFIYFSSNNKGISNNFIWIFKIFCPFYIIYYKNFINFIFFL